jgi:hypothetical protein
MKAKVADPMRTKSGKTRLGPLSLSQLNTMLEGSSKPKEKAKIKARILILESLIKARTKVVAAVTVVAETTQQVIETVTETANIIAETETPVALS